MNANTCLIDLYPTSVVRSCLIYKLEKLTEKQFQVKLSPYSPSGNLELKPPMQSKKPPSPLEFRDAAHGMGMDIFWNHPMNLINPKLDFLDKNIDRLDDTNRVNRLDVQPGLYIQT